MTSSPDPTTLLDPAPALPGLVLLAASGLAREVADASGHSHRIVGVLDDDPDNWGRLLAGCTVAGAIDSRTIVQYALLGGEVLICAGNGTARRAIAARLGAVRYASVVHPSVVVGASSSIGTGVVLLPGVVLTADVVLGDHVVVMPGAVFTHDDVVADYATVCAGVRLAGGVEVGEAAYLGAGALVREGCRIGAGATVGMGAVVLQDVPAGEVWVGNPARPIRSSVTAR